jgi:hypothetical protein
LLDSDVLLKRDISELWRPDCIFVGEVVTQPRSTVKRVLPYVCFINSDACKKNNVHYFDENRMHGLMCNRIIKAADNYDTGGAFYYNCGNLPRSYVKTENYVEHYSGGSWKEVKEMKYAHKLSPTQWIAKYSKFWSTDGETAGKNRKVIYTCVTGNYEPLDNPYAISEGYDYVCFTDSDKVKGDMWELRPIPAELSKLSTVKKQRCIKINPHKYLPEYDLSIWVDGSVKLTKDVNSFIAENCSGSENVYIPQHPNRNCIYDEMDACVKQKKDIEANIAPQRRRYKAEGFPKNYGLVQSNIIIRRHNQPDCIKLMETWWNELKNGSHRDQLSFDYARWKNRDVKVKMLKSTTCESDYFKWDKTHGRKKIPFKKVPAASKNSAPPLISTFPEKIDTVKKPKRNVVKPVKTSNPTLRRKMISNQLKIFLKP